MESSGPWRSRTVVTPQARYLGSAQRSTCACASIRPGMIQRPATSTSPRLRRKLEPRAGAHRFDAAAAHDDGRIGQRRPAAAVDQGGADERDAVRRLRAGRP